MTFKNKQLLPLGIIILTIVCLFLFAPKPQSRLWKNYRVLSVSTGCPENTVLSYLQENGCQTVCSLSQQKLPANVMVSVDRSVLDGTSYLITRNRYFFNKDHSRQLYYIPKAEEKQLMKAVRDMENAGISCVLDTSGSSPVIAPFLLLAVCLFLFAMTSHKKLFCAFIVLPLLFAFTTQSYITAAALSLFVTGICYSLPLWNRRHFLNAVAHAPVLLICFVLPGIACLLCSVRAFLLYILVFCSDWALSELLLPENLPVAPKKNEDGFQPVKILPARFMNIGNGANLRLCAGFVVAALVLLIIFTFTAFTQTAGSGSPDVVPGPSRLHREENLPSIADFKDWYWNAQVLPFTRLSRTRQNSDEKAVIPEYVETADGIQEHYSVKAEKDSQFAAATEQLIKKMPESSVEKLLDSEGEKMKPGFVSLVQSVQNPVLVYSALGMILVAAAVIFILNKCRKANYVQYR